MRDIVAKMETHIIKVSTNKKVVRQRKSVLPRERKFTCTSCQYESDRHFNVIRHQRRIHSQPRPRNCCGEIFVTKGEYYLHCEEVHPERRQNAVTSKLKYKICFNHVVKPFPRRPPAKKSTSHFFKYCLRSKNTKKNYNKAHAGVRTRIDFKYSINYSEFHLENIPLIYFLTDNGLKRYLKTGLSTASKSDKSVINHANNPVEINNSNYVQSENAEERVDSSKYNSTSTFQTENLNGHFKSPIPFELPVKKLILQRFTATTNVKFEKVVITQKSSGKSGMILTENTMQRSKTMTTTFMSEKNKESNVTIMGPCLEKENQRRSTDVSDGYVRIQLDDSIISPLSTQRHRQYLDLINFDHYKIF